MAFPTVGDVSFEARTMLADSTGGLTPGAGEVYTDAVLLPFVQRAYRYAARYLRAKDVSLLRRQSQPILVLNGGFQAIARTGSLATATPWSVLWPYGAGDVVVSANILYYSINGVANVGQTPATSPAFWAVVTFPALPADLVRPIRLRERQHPNPGGVSPYSVMAMSDGFLPDQVPADKFGLWDWREDTIVLPRALFDIDVQMQYEAELPVLTGSGDLVIIPDGLDVVAGLTAAYAAWTRDESENSQRLQTIAERDLDLIAASELLIRKAQGAQWGSN